MAGGCTKSLKAVCVVEHDSYEIQKETTWDGKFETRMALKVRREVGVQSKDE